MRRTGAIKHCGESLTAQRAESQGQLLSSLSCPSVLGCDHADLMDPQWMTQRIVCPIKSFLNNFKSSAWAKHEIASRCTRSEPFLWMTNLTRGRDLVSQYCMSPLPFTLTFPRGPRECQGLVSSLVRLRRAQNLSVGRTGLHP